MKYIKNTLLRSLLTAVMILAGIQTFAQVKVSGIVKDGDGQPVVGAVVMVEGSTSVGTTTDVDGRYTLTIPASVKNPRLTVSCLGYAEQTLPVGRSNRMSFTLVDDDKELEESVVVGYGSMRKRDLTGAVSSVKIDEQLASRVQSLDQMIQGYVAGVQVTADNGSPDAGVSIRIRGMNSLNSDTEPLYVVDGIIINTTKGSQKMLNLMGSANLEARDSDEHINGLAGLNPMDIKSIEILKDASATAIYGALGSNGVVLITTKMADQERPTVRFSAGLDYSYIPKKLDVLNFDEFIQYMKDKNETDVLEKVYEDPVNFTGLKVTPIDWQEYTVKPRAGQRYYFSVSGRPKTLAYSFSLGYHGNGGIVRGTKKDQYTMRLNLEKSFTDRFKVGTRTSFSYVDSDNTQSSAGGALNTATSSMLSMCMAKPYAVDDVEDEDYEPDQTDPGHMAASPVRWTDPLHYVNQRQEFRVSPSLYMEYKLLPWLTFQSKAGGDYRNSEQKKFKSEFISNSYGTVGSIGTFEYMNWNWDNLLIAIKKFNRHNLTATLGTSANQSSSTSQVITGQAIHEYQAGLESLNGAPTKSQSYAEAKSSTLSYFTRLVYNYDERFILTATFRADGSSKFMGANKWAYFPSFAAAWRINQEPWFNVPWVSLFKFRAGWGQVGNQSIGNYRTLANFSSVSHIPSNQTGNESGRFIGVAPTNIANPALKWETTQQTNLGLDLGLWKGRFMFSAEAYKKTTFDLLQSKSIPGSSGYSTIAINDGVIENKGLEFTLEALPLKIGDFEWGINGNISFNRNKLVSISSTSETKEFWVAEGEKVEARYFYGDKLGSNTRLTCPANIFIEGYPMGLFYGYKTDGIIPEGQTGVPGTAGGTGPSAGHFNYIDVNGNEYIDEGDKTIVGNPNPDFTYGFGTTFSWRNISLNAHFDGAVGFDICNLNATFLGLTDGTGNVWRDAYYKAWTPENQDTIYPGVGMINSRDYANVTSFNIEDGSYLRFASLSINYTWNLKNNIVKSIDFGAAMRNLALFTKYRGFDPEVNSFGANVNKMGCDIGSYPKARSFSFDVKFTF